MYVTLHSIFPGNAAYAPARQGFSDLLPRKKYQPPVNTFTAICNPPSDFKVGTVTDSTAYYSWTGIPGSTSYEIEYKDTSSNTWKLIIDQSITNSLTLESLSPGTRYDVRIRTRCNADSSTWVSRQFTTTAGTGKCQAPFDLRAFEIKDSSAGLSWAAWESGNSSHYYVEYKKSSSATWTPVLPPYMFAHEIEYLKNLNPSTTYDWRVMQICNISDSSDWATGNFKTLAGAPPSPTPSTTVNVDFSFSTPACEPALYYFSNNSSANGTTIKTLEWNFGDGSISTSNNPVHLYKKPGTYTVVLTAKDDSGISYSKQQSITINTLALRFADAGKDLILCDETPVKLNASGGVSYTWKPCTGLNNCNIENPEVNPVLNQSYIVTVTSAAGCVDSDTINITLINANSQIFIPTAFTPNNDGINDQFRPLISLQGQANAEWKLFNRFGNMIFSSNSSTAGWDGKYKGEIQPPGNYTYMITIKATGGCPARNMKGTVLLIR